MNPYQQLIEQLSLLVNDDRLLEEKQIESLCVQYRKAVNDINRRLLECDNLFQKGYKTEVVQEAERSPNLLDTVALLDFPDLDLLKTLVSTFQLDPLPSLRHDIAATVNECYSGNQVADRILRQFRLYSLGLAPLEQRLALLRKLHTLDDSNLGWAEDVIVFERARISQIQKEVQSATSSRNIKKLESLYNELRSAEWSEKPSSSIANSIKTTVTQYNSIQIVREAAQLFKKFETAYIERDEDVCLSMIPEIEQYRNDQPSCFNHEQNRTIDDILQWLESEERIRQEEASYQGLLERLDHQLDDQKVLIDQVERTYQSILRMDRKIPDRLVIRFQQKKSASESSKKRKFGLILATCMIALIAISITAALIFRSKGRERRLAEYDSKLNTMITELRLDEADKFMDQIKLEDSSLVNRPQLVKRENELQLAKDQEVKRLNSFEETKEQLKSMLEAEKTTFEGLSKIESVIKDGKKIARLPDEQAAMDRFLTDVIASRTALQKKVDDEFMAKFEPLKQQVEEGSKDLAVLRKLFTDLADLKKASTRVRTERVLLIDPLTTVLNTSIQEQEKMEGEQRDLEKLAREFYTTKTFVEALKVYSNLHPSDASAVQLKPILDTEAPIWHQLEEFAVLQSDINVIQKSKLTSADATKFLDRWKTLKSSLEFLEAFKKDPPSIEYLKAYAKRDASADGSLTAKILGESLVGHPLIQKSKYLCDLDGKAYYITGDPSLNGAGNIYTFRRFMDPEMKRTVITSVRANEIDLNKSTPPSWSNGIRSLSNTVLSGFDKARGDYWDDMLGRLIVDIQADKRVDDILKYRYMTLLISEASEGSPLLKDIFLEHQGVLKQSGVDADMNWANPESKEAAEARSKLKPVMERLPDATATKKKLKQRLDNQPKITSGDIYECAGVLRKGEKNRWNVLRSTRRIDADGDVYVLKTGAEAGFKKVGSKKGAQFDFNIKDYGELAEFRAIWVVTTQGTKSE